MHLLNILSLKKYKLFLLVPVVLLGNIFVYICFHSNIINPYFSIDPDAAYYGNALAFALGYPIHHIDHPGTPLQELLGSYFILITKILHFSNSEIIHYSIVQLKDIVILFRLVCANLFVFGYYFILKSIWIITKRISNVILGFCLLISISITIDWFLLISPESLLIFLFGIYVYVYSLIKTKKIHGRLIYILPCLTGIMLATKLTALPMIFITCVVMVFEETNLCASEIFKRIFLTVSELIIILIIFLSPISDKFQNLSDWTINLLTRPGMHGSGPQIFIDTRLYTQSIQTVIQKDWLFLSFIFLLTLRMLYLKKKFQINHKRTIILTTFLIIGFLFFVLFSKYNQTQYQLINYLLFSFSYAILFAQYNFFFIQLKNQRYVLIIVTLCILYFQCQLLYFTWYTKGIMSSFISDKYNNSLVTIWSQTPPTVDYFIHFAMQFSMVYKENDLKQFSKYWYFYSRNNGVIDDSGNILNNGDFCWQSAFITSAYWLSFQSYYKGEMKKFEIIPSKNKEIFLVKRRDCNSNIF